MEATDVANSFRERRRELGLNQAEAAELAGVSERFLRSLEAGKPTVRLDKVLQVATALGLTVEVRVRDGEH
ncbi:type II toxin-antitoxin system Y4mF family antitoxin [Enemella evansiae]|uniref:type II toxin-antitoxin system Y4mF family antitoxin n=1 Tax=Enemella evansiae TaxID=2016499 RepID=UPI000B977111|nr:type II toxin-antitoxin system Y4mF family antitoxin [Enemella evansiae]OYO01423.1 transcriptional regulator [Enemella evansiae]